MDISDGLSSELLHICSQSNVGCRIYEDRIPIDYPLTLMVGSGAYDESDSVDYVGSNYSIEVSDESDVDEFEEVTEPPVAEKAD